MSPTTEQPPKRHYHLLVTNYKEDHPPERIQGPSPRGRGNRHAR